MNLGIVYVGAIQFGDSVNELQHWAAETRLASARRILFTHACVDFERVFNKLTFRTGAAARAATRFSRHSTCGRVGCRFCAVAEVQQRDYIGGYAVAPCGQFLIYDV